MEKSISNECHLVTIAGYKAWVDSRGIIVEADPKLRKNYLNKHIKDCYKKNGHIHIYKNLGKVLYPTFITQEHYEKMAEKNPMLRYLKEKFDCEIF